MYNDSIFKAIDKLKIYYKGEKVVFNELEKKIIELFSKEENESNIYIIPKDNVYFILLFIVVSGLNQYIRNIYGEDNNMIDEIKIGDILEYSKSRCRFNGIEDGKLKLQFLDLVYHLPMEQLYKVSIYKGKAKKLNKYPSDNNRGSKKTRNIISNVLDIDNGVFTKLVKFTTLIVVNKEVVLNVVNNIKILYDGELLDIGNVFYMAYCSSEENYYYFRGNSSKQEPLIKFTSKIYNAREIVRNDKKINEVIVLQDKIYAEDIDDLIYIAERKNVAKVRIIMEPIDLENHIDNVNLKNKFRITNIDERLLPEVLYSNINYMNKQQYKNIKNYINTNQKFITVKENYADEYRKYILACCRKLVKIYVDNNMIIKYVITARTIAKLLVSLIIPLKDYETLYENNNIYTRIEELKKFIESDFCKQLLEKGKELVLNIYEYCVKFYEKENKFNSKWRELETIIRLTNNQRTAIVVDNKKIERALKYYLKLRYPIKFNIFVTNVNIAKKDQFNKVIYTTRLSDNKYWNYVNFNSDNIIYLFTRFEKRNIKYLKKKYYDFFTQESYEFNNKEEVYDKYNDLESKDVNEIQNLDNELEEFISTTYIPEVQNNNGNIALSNCRTVLTFEDGEKAFITKEYSAFVLHENREIINNKKPEELEKGDILLFIDIIEKDLINRIMKDLLKFNKIKQEYEDDYKIVCEWKDELKRYMDLNNYSFKDIEKKLKVHGTVRTCVTIRSWLVNKVVGPTEVKVFKALGEITGIEILNNKPLECKNSCEKIRKFQILIRKSVARYLLKNSISAAESEIDNLIKDCMEETASKIKKVTIQNIYQVNRDIPVYLTNRIIEE